MPSSISADFRLVGIERGFLPLFIHSETIPIMPYAFSTTKIEAFVFVSGNMRRRIVIKKCKLLLLKETFQN